ncbi:uncharacterized protein LOC116212456 isoform X2 [Punica granatum]|uniref:Uncharacterized protein LOC116212456 isoform X2 n=1 Tax=Punica granatum TaxID=22663 RepID=A0A6P8DZE2_PUNGR|nr:uncharacterized protein LOC116212456 isoform X2 [Punica granatum]
MPRRSSSTQTDGDQSEIWSRPNWLPRLDKVLVDVITWEMIDYHPDGYVNSFDEQAWDRVVVEFNKLTSLSYDKAELKKQVSLLRKRYRIVKPLYNHGGFGWNYRRKMVDVDDTIWREYIEVHPEIAPYRKWGCPIYEQLCTIFTKPLATGKYAISSADVASPRSHAARPNRTINHSGGRSNKRPLPQPPTSAPNKKPNPGKETSCTKTVAPEASQVDDDPHSLARCLTLISGMQEVNHHLHSSAMDLFQNPTWRKTFVQLREEKRLSWLKAMLP